MGFLNPRRVFQSRERGGVIGRYEYKYKFLLGGKFLFLCDTNRRYRFRN